MFISTHNASHSSSDFANRQNLPLPTARTSTPLQPTRHLGSLSSRLRQRAAARLDRQRAGHRRNHAGGGPGNNQDLPDGPEQDLRHIPGGLRGQPDPGRRLGGRTPTKWRQGVQLRQRTGRAARVGQVTCGGLVVELNGGF